MRPIIKRKRREKNQRPEMEKKESECEHVHIWGKMSWWHFLSPFQTLGPAPSLNFSTIWTKYLLKLAWVGSLFINSRKNPVLYIRLKLYIFNPISTKKAVETIHPFVHSFVHPSIHPSMQWTSSGNLLCSRLSAQHFGYKNDWDVISILKEFPTLEREMDMWMNHSW